MMLDEINRKFRILDRVRPKALWPDEGTMLGLKVSHELREQLNAIQAKYGLRTYRETVLTCILIGVETLHPKP